MEKGQFGLHICAAVVLLIVTIKGEPTTATPTPSTVTCPAYCDKYGILRESFTCKENQFCCGTLYERGCCVHKTESIPDNWYSNQSNLTCPGSSVISSYHWQFLLGVMGILVLLVVIAACCCQCCSHKVTWDDSRRRREAWGSSANRRNRADTTVSTIELDNSSQHQPEFFDPSHPFAFVPPDYDSLPKNPPPYSELFGGEGGSTNNGFDSAGDVGLEIEATTSYVTSPGTSPSTAEEPPAYTSAPAPVEAPNSSSGRNNSNNQAENSSQSREISLPSTNPPPVIVSCPSPSAVTIVVQNSRTSNGGEGSSSNTARGNNEGGASLPNRAVDNNVVVATPGHAERAASER